MSVYGNHGNMSVYGNHGNMSFYGNHGNMSVYGWSVAHSSHLNQSELKLDRSSVLTKHSKYRQL